MHEQHLKRIHAIRDGIDEAEAIGALSFIQSSNMAYLCRMLEDEMDELFRALRVIQRNMERAEDALTVQDNADLLRAIIAESKLALERNDATEGQSQ